MPRLAVGLTVDEAKGIPVSMGNPHFVMFVDDFAPQWQELAAEVAGHRDFPNGTNVELVRVLNEHEIECVSGSAASARHSPPAPGRARRPWPPFTPAARSRRFACIRLGERKPWSGMSQVYLTGSATLLCRGEFFS